MCFSTHAKTPSEHSTLREASSRFLVLVSDLEESSLIKLEMNQQCESAKLILLQGRKPSAFSSDSEKAESDAADSQGSEREDAFGSEQEQGDADPNRRPAPALKRQPMKKKRARKLVQYPDILSPCACTLAKNHIQSLPDKALPHLYT